MKTALRRLRNRHIARALTRFPSLARLFMHSHRPREAEGVPGAPPLKPLEESRVALVTTAGVHRRGQPPFDMSDPHGDPTFRVIDGSAPVESLTITHDYYDHSDADRDINIVFPIERLREFQAEGLVGEVSGLHLGFMGHITGPHEDTLVGTTAPEAARALKQAGVDAVLLTPG